MPIKVFGFSCAAGGAWSGRGSARVHRFYFNNRPAEWRQIYDAKRIFDADPYPITASRRRTPFLLSEEEQDLRKLSPEASEIVDLALAYGWREVMGIPIHGPDRYQGLVTMSSKDPVTLSEPDKAVIQAITNAIHDRCHKTIGFGTRNKPMPALTEREIEAMRWVSQGKSDAEIATILGISSSTAHFHVEKTKKKLETNSRTEAVARLILEGII